MSCEFLKGNTCDITREYCAIPNGLACSVRVNSKANTPTSAPDEITTMADYWPVIEGWLKAGQRSAKVDAGSFAENGLRIWLYDYAAMAGVHVGIGDVIPATKDIAATRKAELQRELEQMR